MKRVVQWVVILLLLTACDVNLLGPEDPTFEDECVFYAAEAPVGAPTKFNFSRSEIRRVADVCAEVEFWVVKFNGPANGL